MNTNENKNTCDILMETNEEFIRLRATVEHFIFPIAQSLGITPIQVAVLNLIRKTERPTVSKLVKILDFNQGNMSSLCKKLEGDGLITRTRCSEDERRYYLSLTQKGEEIIENVNSRLSFPELSAVLSDEELKAAGDALLILASTARKVTAVLDSHNKNFKENNNA